MLFIVFFLAFFVVSAFFFFYTVYWKRRGLPDGPIPLPIFGNTLEIARYPPGYEAFFRWKERYGPVYTVWFGEDPVVVFADYPSMRDTFQREGMTFAGRYFLGGLLHVLPSIGGLFGITRNEGEVWRRLHQFTSRTLRSLGAGVSGGHLESRILDAFELFCESIEKEKIVGEIDGHEIAERADRFTGSVINQVLFGYIYDTEERLREYRRLKKVQDLMQRVFMRPSAQMLCSMPWLRHIPWSPFSRSFNAFDDSFQKIYAHFQGLLDERIEQRRSRKNLQAGSEGEEKNEKDMEEREEEHDYVGSFLEQMEKKVGEEASEEMNENPFTIRHLIAICFDLWAAGLVIIGFPMHAPSRSHLCRSLLRRPTFAPPTFTLYKYASKLETTTSTINFEVLYLLLDIRVQRKLHDELEHFLALRGGHREAPILLADRPSLPYTNAVINETQRFCNLVPINLFHRTTTNCTVNAGGKQWALKKGTICIPQICTVLFDEKVFPEPERFLPERFLDDEGRVKRIDEFIPFSIGKRSCIGESLAKMEMFLFTANFFKRYWVFPVDPLHPPSIERRTAISVVAQPYRCRVVRCEGMLTK